MHRNDLAMTEEQIISAMVSVLASEGVESLENEALLHEQVDLSLKEMLIGELYVREITIPAGTMLSSKVWLGSYVDIMISGKIAVMTPDGITQLSGYNLLRGKKSRKRCGYAYEETKWVTVHKTSCLNLDGIEDKMTVDTVEQSKRVINAISRHSYSALIKSLGVDERELHNAVTDVSTHATVECHNTYVAESAISASGLFSRKDFTRGDFISYAAVDGIRTNTGRYCNHSPAPNCKFIFKDGNNAIMIALDDIYENDELTVDYSVNIDYLRS